MGVVLELAAPVVQLRLDVAGVHIQDDGHVLLLLGQDRGESVEVEHSRAVTEGLDVLLLQRILRSTAGEARVTLIVDHRDVDGVQELRLEGLTLVVREQHVQVQLLGAGNEAVQMTVEGEVHFQRVPLDLGAVAGDVGLVIRLLSEHVGFLGIAMDHYLEEVGPPSHAH